MVKTLSLEYCHVTPGFDIKKEINDSNKWTPLVLKMFNGWKIQKCIMIDDIHATQPVDDKFIKKLIDKLTIKPDCIFKESEFIPEAHKMVESIDPKERDFIYSGERVWLRENATKYRSTTEFLLSWKGKDGKTRFSCPSLATTSYLVRLGYIKKEGIKTIYGDKLMISNQVLNILSSSLLQVEDKSQSIVEATYKEALRKISWFFY
tara:strand:- start:552 stop:1169 length:618 start_codon:yes stop_codon:yes gene_type:complete